MIKAILGLFGGGVALWQTLLAGALATAIATSAASLYAYNAGWRNADNAHAAAKLEDQRKHSRWLVETAERNGIAAQDDFGNELANEELQRRIDDAISKPAPGPVDCLPGSFLQQLNQLR